MVLIGNLLRSLRFYLSKIIVLNQSNNITQFYAFSVGWRSLRFCLSKIIVLNQ